MKIMILPEELRLEKEVSVQVFDYQSAKELARQQIVLKQNTLSFLIEGTKEVFFDNSMLGIDTTQFLIMKSGHCLMTEKLSESSNYRSILLFFTDDILLKLIRKTGHSKVHSSEQKSVYAFSYDTFIHGYVHSLINISKLSKSIQHRLLEVKLEEILLYLTEIYGPAFLDSLASHSNDIHQKLTIVVETNRLNKLTLNELAFLCDMSVSTFKREFEKQYSESPIKWFQNQRLEHANELLNLKNSTASEIYPEAGYENLSSFIQAYKSKYGITPKQHHKH